MDDRARSVGIWLALLVAAAVTAAVGVSYYAGHDLSTLNGAARAAGSAVALFAIPGLLPLIWWAFRKFRSHAARGPLTVWTLLLCLISLSHMAAVTYQKGAPAASAYTFQPDRCEFSVSFPEKPREYSVEKVDASGRNWPLFGAEYILTGERGLLRAECVSFDSLGQSQLTNELMKEGARQIALDMGIQRASIGVERGRCGVVAEISGVKETERGRLLVEITNYHGKHSILTLYLAALSKDWKPEAMTAFARSLQCHL